MPRNIGPWSAKLKLVICRWCTNLMHIHGGHLIHHRCSEFPSVSLISYFIMCACVCVWLHSLATTFIRLLPSHTWQPSCIIVDIISMTSLFVIINTYPACKILLKDPSHRNIQLGNMEMTSITMLKIPWEKMLQKGQLHYKQIWIYPPDCSGLPVGVAMVILSQGVYI